MSKATKYVVWVEGYIEWSNCEEHLKGWFRQKHNVVTDNITDALMYNRKRDAEQRVRSLLGGRHKRNLKAKVKQVEIEVNVL